jgi:hypothetical protein
VICNRIASLGGNQGRKKRQDNGIGGIDRMFFYWGNAKLVFESTSLINPVDPENPVIPSFWISERRYINGKYSSVTLDDCLSTLRVRFVIGFFGSRRQRVIDGSCGDAFV